MVEFPGRARAAWTGRLFFRVYLVTDVKVHQAQHGRASHSSEKREREDVVKPRDIGRTLLPVCLPGTFQRRLACARSFLPLAQIVYARLLRLLYKLQVQIWRLVRKHDPQPYEHSVLGFLEPRLRMLSRVSAACSLWFMRHQLEHCFSRIADCAGVNEGHTRSNGSVDQPQGGILSVTFSLLLTVHRLCVPRAVRRLLLLLH